MPSPRRIRLLMMAAAVTVVFLFFYSSSMDPENAARTRDDFYSKTKQAMDHGKHPPGQAVLDSQTGQKAGHIPADKDADGDVDEDDQAASLQMQERLKAAEQEAKDKANEKGGMRPDPPSNVVGVGSSAEGQKKDKDKLDKSSSGSSDTAASKEKVGKSTKEESQAEVELSNILKKAPVVIFSKTYCQFSKRAKGLLLEKYLVTPEPYIVELDEHPLGPLLQDELLKQTGRRTVPNIMINGVSIGGADDIVALDNNDDLVTKILGFGQKRVDIVERFVSGSKAN